ncbi:MAG: hypothetical protein JST67_03170, partial [Bacteroidetes bacterium]|nr:hypothetical protein [Bacteroidota bacterium]
VKLADLKNVNIIFNAHEYYPLEFDDLDEWIKNTQPTYLHIAKTYLNKVNICFCVGQIIADKYKQEFGLHSVVIPNAKPFYDLQPTLLKEGEKIKIIHHGGAAKSRKIELTIEMMQYLGQGFQLDLILVPGSEEYIEEIKEKAKPYSNIRFLEPVPLYDIPTFLNTYDIGLFLLPPTNYNYANALPNKFFEFVQARLAIAIAPSPEMALLTQKYDLGVVAPDFTPQALANKIKELTVEKIMYHKNQCHKHAKELNSGVYQDLIKKTVDELL